MPAPSTPSAAGPQEFRAAVDSLSSTRVRSEISIEPIRPPQRLAPWAYAITAIIRDSEGDELASGKLVLLHDPDGDEAWDGTLRLVAYATAEIEPDIGLDVMLPAVGWSWLTESLDERGAEYAAVGGTVTQTNSTRFGDIHGPHTTIALEFRASWTARTSDLRPHLLAFADLLSTAAGLPPEGVAILRTT